MSQSCTHAAESPVTRPNAAEFQLTFTKPAYTVAEWAEACSLGRTTIREHIDANNLVISYPTRTKGIITLEEGMRWLRSLPSEPLS